MASRLSMEDVFQLVDDDDFGLSSGEESDFGGEGITGYLPWEDYNIFDDADGGGGPEEESEEDDGGESASDEPGMPSGHETG